MAFSLAQGDPIQAREIYRTMSYADCVEAVDFTDYMALGQELQYKK